MRVVTIQDTDSGELSAFNPNEIEWVNGRGVVWTVYLRSGRTVNFNFKSGGGVTDFIKTWSDALCQS